MDFNIDNNFKHKLVIDVNGFLSWLLYSYLIWSFFRFSFTNVEKNAWWVIPYISPLTKLIEPLFILLLFFSSIAILSKAKVDRKAILFVFFTISAFIISFILENDSLVNSLKFFGGYYKFIPLFIISSFLYRKGVISLRSMILIIMVIIMVQFLINLLWFFDIQILQNTRTLVAANPDWAYGTMENTHMLAATFIVVFITGLYFINKKGKFNIALGFALLLVGIIQVAWAESKANFLTIALSLTVLILLEPHKKISVGKIALILGILMSFILAGSIFYPELSHFTRTSSDGIFANIGHFWNIFLSTLRYNYKFQFLHFIIFEFQDQYIPFLFGAGPGTLASNFALENPTSLSNKYFIPLMNKTLQHGNSILLNPHTGYTAILGDLGWFGFVSYFGFYFYLLYKICQKYRRNFFAGNLQRLSAMIWIGLTINYLLNNIFKDSLYIGAPMVIIWILGGLLLHTKNYNKIRFTVKKVA